ncbi:RsmB/NOP family class I SAM-dependent RNA methyltransferase [Sphingosinicella sp. BN140058]|uniref:RsmB/NOP family class I SAM-dependent RNA methyltransferase n=1 Tax=Sphingosinicella sp. BN140058 TaxID=1892855 RepID=UPI001012B53B|nr:RsmB/NOP family class I SAM-dependent RNA methyltransferase [Sphingosinicella sp. BN140058]QAY79188.1 RsmB/NOP family class I SAM-dependent RNA methyltransferase [Sphingosinicella sp. BN140058]
MTPAARVQAAIELLDEIIVAARTAGPAADTLITRWFKTRRFAGSKDRRAVRELVYRAIRRAGEPPASGRAAMLGVAEEEPELRALFDGSPHGPAPIAGDEAPAPASVAPRWLDDLFDPTLDGADRAALLDRAPLDLRVNRLKGEREVALEALPDAVPTPLSPIGLRLPEGSRIEEGQPWLSGLVEVQDEGSQLLALACEAHGAQTVVDLCAGAGGKTLALAAEMENKGRLIAADADRSRLSRMAPRLVRAGVSNVETLLLNPGREREALADLRGTADIVLVDAPCSGTGTWRRNPETRWRLTPDRLARLVALQSQLLDVAAELVRPGGFLVYAVCSLLRQEGRDQADRFSARSSLVPAPLAITAGSDARTGRILAPARDNTDGFFVARWQAPC